MNEEARVYNESYKQGQWYQRYKKNLILQPYFTHIPRQYWIDNAIIGTTNYIKKKIGVDKNSQLTLKQKLSACVRFPEIACTQMLGIHPRPYQHYDLDQTYANRYIVKACSRRVGKTFTNRITLLHTSRFNLLNSEIGGTTWNVVLQDQDIANDLYIEPLHEIMEHADKITDKNFQGKLGTNFWTSALITPRDKVGKVKSNKISMRTKPIPEIGVKAGINRISTFAPTKKVIGREGNLMGDEVSKWKDNPKCKDEFKFYDQLIAILKDNPTYKAIFASTPEGEEDLFAEIFDPTEQNITNKYKKLWLPYWVRQTPHWIKEIHDTENDSIKKRRHHLFLQEYEANFLTITNPFFHPHDIDNHIADNWRKSHSTMPCSLGIDWGGTETSETAWAIREWGLKPDSPRPIINKKSYPVGKDLTQLEPDLHTIKRNYNIKWVTPDNKGGRWMIPTLERIFGTGRVKPFNFTTDKKPGYEKTRTAILNGHSPIPNDTKLIKQLKSLTEETLKPVTRKGLDDEADAYMLSLQPIYDQQPKRFKIWTY